MQKSRPPPKTTYEKSKEQAELEKIRDENHRQGLHKLHQTRSLSYHFMQTEKSDKAQAARAKIIEEYEQELQPEKFRANPPPQPQVYFQF